MSTDAHEQEEGFLQRWSRMKTEVRAAPAPAPEVTEPARIEEPPPQLPPIENLTIDSDFKDFFHPKVDESVRRAALRKLFSDPHFNVMDGLDVYIDDYSKPDPIPAAMLAGLKQAQRIIDWARNEEETPKERAETVTGAAPIETTAPPELPDHDVQTAAPDVPLEDPQRVDRVLPDGPDNAA